MYKILFQNSKIALAFAAMTIFGAVSMVGTSEQGGVLDATIDQLLQQRDDYARQARALSGTSVEGGTGSAAGARSDASVFGNYAPATGPAPTMRDLVVIPVQGPNPLPVPPKPAAASVPGTRGTFGPDLVTIEGDPTDASE